jgi:hypothetical protein
MPASSEAARRRTLPSPSPSRGYRGSRPSARASRTRASSPPPAACSAGERTTSDSSATTRPTTRARRSTSGVVSVGAADSLTCVVTSAGAAKCWGKNDKSQLGNGAGGTLQESDVPVDVTGLTTGVTKVSPGYEFACAVVAGAAQCWGDNFDGTLGNGAGPGVGSARDPRQTLDRVVPCALLLARSEGQRERACRTPSRRRGPGGPSCDASKHGFTLNESSGASSPSGNSIATRSNPFELSATERSYRRMTRNVSAG